MMPRIPRALLRQPLRDAPHAMTHRSTGGSGRSVVASRENVREPTSGTELAVMFYRSCSHEHVEFNTMTDTPSPSSAGPLRRIGVVEDHEAVVLGPFCTTATTTPNSDVTGSPALPPTRSTN